MLALTLPTWLDADNLRTILLLVVVGLLVLAYLVARFVQELAVKVIALSLIGVVGLVLWSQRTDLGECISNDDCECTIVGLEVPLPSAADRLRCA